jgi:argininosuccinate lyase
MSNPILGGVRGQGEGARLREGPAPELMQSSFRLEINDAPILWMGLSLADLAHVLMLREVGVIPAPEGDRLLQLLLELHQLPLAEFSMNLALEDVYSNREGRPRREPATIAHRIAARERLLTLASSLLDLCRAIIDLADTHTTTLMPDYTYLQHAHPTTLAHYLLSFAYPILRDVDRLQGCFLRINQSPAGIGNINGSGLPVDRCRVAELLSFDGVIVNTRDAMWQVDGPVEVMAMVMALLLHLGRLAEDLQIWNTSEFNLIELADRHARISLIMPQKKNPYALAFIRGIAGNMMGKLVSMTAVGKTPSAQMDNRIFVLGEVPRALDETIDAVRLMASILRGLQFNTELMAARASEGFVQATDLAELIMQTTQINYRTAHHLVGMAIRLALERGVDTGEIPADILEEAACQVLGHSLNLPAALLLPLADPAAIVATRQGLGGAAREPVCAMIEECRQLMAAGETWQSQTARRLGDAEKRLLELATALASGT